MADDIDIEEHDVMDNPQIRSIFPDISVLKKEIQSYFDEALEVKQESASCNYPLDSLKKNDSGTGTDPLKLTKGPSVSNDLQPLSTTKDIKNDKDIFPDKVQKLSLQDNKIILGSKTNTQLEHEEFSEKQDKPTQPMLVLEDLGPYLDRSNRYCVQCLILFPDKSSLASHNLNAHKEFVHLNQGNNLLNSKLKKGLVKPKNTHNSKENKCTSCNTSFSTNSNLQRHYKNCHIKKNQTSKIRGSLLTRVRNKLQESVHVGAKNECFHCKISFSSQKSLIEHLYNILQSKTISCNECSEKFSDKYKLKEHMVIHDKMEKIKKHENIIKVNSQKMCPEVHKEVSNPTNECLYYKCHICSYYFKTAKFCLAHVNKKHKAVKCHKIIGVPYSSKCNYCSQEFANMSAYNTHLKQSHSQQYNTNLKHKGMGKKSDKIKDIQQSNSQLLETRDSKSVQCEDILAYKSTLFKCNRCDIHFLSAIVASNHSDHMEMLINWKCSTCQRIFKKEDEVLHLKQHSFTDQFIVRNLSSSELDRVLYNCPKCTVHFTEDNFMSHYPECGTETPNSVYCIVCDFLIDHVLDRSHKLGHQLEKLKSSDFTIIESDVIPNNYTMEGRKNLSTIHSQNLKRKHAMENTNNSHNMKIKRAVKEGQVDSANKIQNIVRKSDGKTTVVSKKMKFDLGYMYNLSYCNTCKCFITDLNKIHTVHLESRCEHLVKYVCKICGLVLTAKSYQTHKEHHRRKKNLKLKDFNFYELGSDKQICPPIPEFPKCKVCEVCFVSKVASKTHVCSEENYLTCHICETKLSEDTFKLHKSFHNYSKMNVKHTEIQGHSSRTLKHTETNIAENVSITEKSPVSTMQTTHDSVSKTSENSKNISPGSQGKIMYETFLFSCMNCSVTVHTYDKVIQHCQDHYTHEGNQTDTDICHLCELKFDKTCHEKHQTLHLHNYDKDSFQLFKFDIFYFTSENHVWLKHIFGNLSQEQIDKIIGTSIYKIECRIKLEISQDGSSDLTVYKCDKCRCFVNGTSLYRHAANPCFKLKKHPCSICGLPYLSAVSRKEHEKIHKRPKVGIKSYRIVEFNREDDKILDSAICSFKQYVLYQCRNCNVVVDKSRVKDHECNENNLKKCVDCGLLLPKEEFKLHASRHKDLVSFTNDNMKVILFGEVAQQKTAPSSGLVSSFSGTIYDYTLYSCAKCQVCVKTLQLTLKHSCVFGTSSSKCPNCDLYFVTNNIKYHRRLHETDRDFLRENMRIIPFDSLESKESNTKSDETLNTSMNIQEISILEADPNNETNSVIADNINNKDITSQDTENDANNCDDDYTEKNAKIYKCTCGLHFLDETSISAHFKICNPRIRASKQKCTKCDLLFTPNILFSHLLMHHGNIKCVYKFDVVEISKNKRLLYKCLKCNIHFGKEQDAKEHFKTCNAKDNNGSECTVCRLIFDNSSLILHKNNKECSIDYEIIDVGLSVQSHWHNSMQSNNKITKQVVVGYNNTIYKCKQCGIHYLTKKTMRQHLGENHVLLTKLQDICNICGLNFISSSLAKHIAIHHEKLDYKANDLIVMECVGDHI